MYWDILLINVDYSAVSFVTQVTAESRRIQVRNMLSGNFILF